MSKILVIGESVDGALRNVSFETIATARKINEGAEVVGLLLSNSDLNSQAGEMIHHGADRVITVTHDNLEHYTSDGYGQVILEVMEEEAPDAVIMGHTAAGKDATPKIAERLEIGLISDAIDIEVDGDDVLFTRPIYSGKAFEKKKVKEGLVFATIRPNNIAMLEKDESRTGAVDVKAIDVKEDRKSTRLNSSHVSIS